MSEISSVSGRGKNSLPCPSLERGHDFQSLGDGARVFCCLATLGIVLEPQIGARLFSSAPIDSSGGPRIFRLHQKNRLFQSGYNFFHKIINTNIYINNFT